MMAPNILNLTHSQEQAIYRFAGKQVIASAAKHSAKQLVERLDDDVAGTMVLGAFVSLKREGQLRSCMGCLAQELMPLGVAVETAAARSATDDPRFPPISPTELASLDLEVWLLWGMRRLEEQGRDRLNVIEIGRHGLQISQGLKRGLLLPGVATEHRLNTLEFLEAVCQKAGLLRDAWFDDRSELSVFEGMAISGTLAPLLQDRIKPSYYAATKGPSSRDVTGLCNAARDNFFHHLDGMTPNFYQPQFYDGSMAGVALTITLPDSAPLTCARNGIKADIPLQSSLTEFSAVLAEQIRRIGPDTVDLLQTRFDLFVQWDVAIHGSLDSYDLSRLDTKHRSLMLSVGDRWAIAYDVAKPPEQLLDTLLEKLDIDSDTQESNRIFSFETQSTSTNFAVESMPRQPIFPKLRPAMLPGAFYPKLAKEIETELTRMFAPGEIVPTSKSLVPLPPANFDRPIKALAALVPHAGWVYSGRLAAQTLLRTEIPVTVVIFAPRHRVGGANWAVAPYETWGIPFGNVAADLDWATRFVTAVPHFQFDETPHKHEHAVEVQLPLIARLNPAAKVVGVTMVGGDWDEIENAAVKFAAFLKQSATMPLLVISSDMNHFATEDTTRNVDKMALDAIRANNPELFFDTVLTKQISMCGVYAAAFVLKTLQELGDLHEAVPIGYTTSSAVSGDLQRVVGYAGMLFR
ncbi:MAG: AmmeMemoRadiSam system protein B [Planctomycetaceae bacterium]|nr:AmmeMemoRadiSam system protein B [Planctomycetaceae bacterium]